MGFSSSEIFVFIILLASVVSVFTGLTWGGGGGGGVFLL